MLSLIALTAASFAVAPVADASEPSAIVVEGIRQRDRAIHDYVSAVTPAPIGGQISRFASAVCPAAVGLSDAQNARVAARMRVVASAIGLHVASQGCRPNALVVVVNDKDDFVHALRKKYPAYFYDPLGSPVRIPDKHGAAIAWHISTLMTADNLPAAVHEQGVTHYETSSMDASRLIPSALPHFVAGMVVVNVAPLAGLTTLQLADYASMRVYAATDPAKLKPSASTILSIVDAPMGTPVPLSLTNWDFSFLKALYSIDNRQFENRERNAIERIVARDDRRARSTP